MKNRTWYEVRLGGASSSHFTLEEARAELDQMKQGYPSNTRMTKENHQYWKRVSSKAEIYKVVQTSEKIF